MVGFFACRLGLEQRLLEVMRVAEQSSISRTRNERAVIYAPRAHASLPFCCLSCPTGSRDTYYSSTGKKEDRYERVNQKAPQLRNSNRSRCHAVLLLTACSSIRRRVGRIHDGFAVGSALERGVQERGFQATRLQKRLACMKGGPLLVSNCRTRGWGASQMPGGFQLI